MNRPNRCQVSLLWLLPRSTIPQTYEAWQISPKGARRLHAQVASLRNKTVVFSGVALLVAMALFYFLGGRSLARRHGKALKGATRDPLTNLGNHSAFQEELTRAVAFAARRREPMALAPSPSPITSAMTAVATRGG